MARMNFSVALFVSLLWALLVGEILACNTSKNRFNKQDRFYRHHNYVHHNTFGKRSVDEKDQMARSTYREMYDHPHLNTSCGNALCDTVPNYPHEAIRSAVKQLKDIHETSQALREKIDPLVMNLISEYLNSDESTADSPDIVYEEKKGCKAIGNVSFPQEGYTHDDGQIYYVVNVPDFLQKVNGFTCQKSKTECGDDIELPSTYSRTCKQVYRDEEFLVLPGNRSQYNVDDFRVRTFLVADGCKCVLLHTGDYEFLKGH